jgi:hypothetical protein
MKVLDLRVERGQIVARVREGARGVLEDDTMTWPLEDLLESGMAFEDDDGLVALVLEVDSELRVRVRGGEVVARFVAS